VTGARAAVRLGKHRSRVQAALLPAVLLWGLASCGSSHTNDYGAAAAGLGLAVAGAAVYRAATGNCWASCPSGHVCDRESGLCVALECAPGCPVGQECVRDLDGKTRCAPSAGAVTLGAAAASDAGAVGSDAGVGTSDPSAGDEDAGLEASQATGFTAPAASAAREPTAEGN
jgi:hypothetical protein